MNPLIFSNPRLVIVELLVIFASITLHEFGHAISADRLGDDTPRRQGRLNLWPDRHLEPLGTIMIIVTCLIGRGIGWGRPVQFNAYGLKNPRRGLLIVAACGPLMNLLLAIATALILRGIVATHHTNWLTVPGFDLADYDGTFSQNLTYAAYIGNLSLPGMFLWGFLSLNLVLMFFNLIPIHPLDGSKILSSLLPIDQAVRYDRFVGTYGPMLLVAVAFLAPQVIGTLISPAVNTISNLFIGSLPG